MGTFFEIAVRNVLESFGGKIPTYYKKVWDLNPDVMLNVNLDGFSRKSYDALRTGHTADYFMGNSVSDSRSILVPGRKLVVDLHGHVDVPKSWILSEADRDALISDRAYTQFLREILSSNTVLFYGVSVDDVSITGQLSYLRQIGFIHGEYFLAKRGKEAKDWEVIQEFGIQIIYLDPDLSWEQGFSVFVEALIRYRAKDAESKPVRAEALKVHDIPPPAALVSKTPDEIRLTLNAATNMYYNGNVFDYEKYTKFCADYDSVIHLKRVAVKGIHGK